MTGSTAAGADSTGEGLTSSTDPSGSSSDTAGAGGPIELYRGPVEGGIVPGWDREAPRPLVMMGRQDQDWVATLARIDAQGNLSDNVAEEIVVWGFEVDPPVLYDGPVAGGVIDGWDASVPIPLVMMGYSKADETWVSTLASISPDGTLGDNVADRIIVWGWSGPQPGAPSLRYEGLVDGGTLEGWNADDPDPLVMLGTPGLDVWIATLVRIGPDGSLSDNTATSIRIWGW